MELYWQTTSHAERGKSFQIQNFLGGMQECRRFAPTPFRVLIPISNFGGVCWTKFECILPKILTKNEMRLGHARGLACAKTKKFPCIFLASPPPTPPPRSGKRNGKEIFGFASPSPVTLYHTIVIYYTNAIYCG